MFLIVFPFYVLMFDKVPNIRFPTHFFLYVFIRHGLMPIPLHLDALNPNAENIIIKEGNEKLNSDLLCVSHSYNTSHYTTHLFLFLCKNEVTVFQLNNAMIW